MKKLLNDRNNNHKLKKEEKKNTLYKSMMRVEKDFSQQQGKAQAKGRLEEVKKKFINLLMRDGEKCKAHKLFTDSLNLLEKKSMTIAAVTLSSRVEVVSKGEEIFAPPIYKGDVKKRGGVTVYKSHLTDKKSELGKKHSILCDNKAELFQFYTVYNRVEKNGTFKKNEKLKNITIPPLRLSSRVGVADLLAKRITISAALSETALSETAFYETALMRKILRQFLTSLIITPPDVVREGHDKGDLTDLLSKRDVKSSVDKSPKVLTFAQRVKPKVIEGVKPKVIKSVKPELLKGVKPRVIREEDPLRQSLSKTTKGATIKGAITKDGVVMGRRSGLPTKSSVLKSPKVFQDSTNKNNKSESKNNSTQGNSQNDFLKNHILYQAIENIKPPLELRRVRKGGTTYQVPAIVSQKKQERLAIKWIIESACKRKSQKGNTFSESLVTEILEAFNKTGQPRQKRDEMLKIAQYNRAYTRYRWW